MTAILTEKEEHILQHSLGISYREPGFAAYRNRYCSNKITDILKLDDTDMAILDLVEKGFLKKTGSTKDYDYYIVTEVGAARYGIDRETWSKL